MSNTSRTDVRHFAAVLFLLILPFLLSAQEVIDTAQYRAVYEFSYKTKPDQTEYAKADLMYLDIGQKASKFYSHYEQIRDSIKNAKLQDNESPYHILEQLKSYPRGYSSVFYQFYQERRGIVTSFFGMYPYMYEENLNMPKWEITRETKDIAGYQSQKATTFFLGREWIVYFAPEIPINKGPWKLWGLPGLIVHAEDSEHLFDFKLNGFQSLNEITPIILQNTDANAKHYQKTSKKNFARNEKLFHKDANEYFKVIEGAKFIFQGKTIPPKMTIPFIPLEPW